MPQRQTPMRLQHRSPLCPEWWLVSLSRHNRYQICSPSFRLALASPCLPPAALHGCSFAHRMKEAIPIITNTGEDSTARPSEFRILIADACPISPRHHAVIVLGFTFESCICWDIVWQGVATEEQWLRTYTSVGPGHCLVLKENTTPRDAWWPRQAFLHLRGAALSSESDIRNLEATR